MHVVIDCRYAFPHLSGIGRYVVNLVCGLAELGTASKTSHQSPTGIDEAGRPNLEASDVRISVLHRAGTGDLALYLGDTAHRVQIVEVAGSPRGLSQQWKLPGLLRRLGADLFHTPDAFAPLLSPCPVIITIHDVIPLAARGELGAKSLKASLSPVWARWQKWQCRRAARVLTTTRHSASDIARYLHADPNKVKVVNPGVVASAHRRPSAEMLVDVKRRFGLDGPYILFVGRREPYKNLVGLVRAISELVGAFPGLKLVAVGHRDERFPEPELEADRLGVGDRLIVTGHVPDDTVNALYAGAAALGLASFYEGFGYPPLEALSFGTPVVTSRLTSLPEVLGPEGDGVIYVDAGDSRDIARGLRLALTDEGLRTRLQERVRLGTDRSSHFTVQRQAAETLAIYRDVLAERRGQ